MESPPLHRRPWVTGSEALARRRAPARSGTGSVPGPAGAAARQRRRGELPPVRAGAHRRGQGCALHAVQLRRAGRTGLSLLLRRDRPLRPGLVGHRARHRVSDRLPDGAAALAVAAPPRHRVPDRDDVPQHPGPRLRAAAHVRTDGIRPPPRRDSRHLAQRPHLHRDGRGLRSPALPDPHLGHHPAGHHPEHRSAAERSRADTGRTTLEGPPHDHRAAGRAGAAVGVPDLLHPVSERVRRADDPRQGQGPVRLEPHLRPLQRDRQLPQRLGGVDRDAGDVARDHLRDHPRGLGALAKV